MISFAFHDVLLACNVDLALPYSPEAEGLEADLVTAVKDVADSLPGDSGRTTSELLRKLQEHVVLTSDQKHGQVKKAVR